MHLGDLLIWTCPAVWRLDLPLYGCKTATVMPSLTKLGPLNPNVQGQKTNCHVELLDYMLHR